MFTLCVDPGVRALGAAVFRENNPVAQIAHAALIRNPYASGNGPAEIFALTEQLIRWLASHVLARSIGRVIVEVPRVYPAARQTGDQNDLIAVAGVAYAASVSVISATERLRYFPHEWKGTVKKETCTARIRERLNAFELASIEHCPKSLEHNVIDAIGIGLKFFGRFEPHRVYPR